MWKGKPLALFFVPSSQEGTDVFINTLPDGTACTPRSVAVVKEYKEKIKVRVLVFRVSSTGNLYSISYPEGQLDLLLPPNKLLVPGQEVVSDTIVEVEDGS
jgi:hypothetical protein